MDWMLVWAGMVLGICPLDLSNLKKALCYFLWAASTDRTDHWPSVAYFVVTSDDTKNEPRRHKGTKMSFYMAD